MGGKRGRWGRIGAGLLVAGVLLFSVTLALSAIGAPDQEFDRAVGWANIGAFVLAAVGLGLVLLPGTKRQETPGQTADELAAAGLQTEGAALRELLFAGREPGHRANLTFRAGALVRFRSAAKRGDLESVADFYRENTGGRMVVLGAPGAGKTTLALTLVCHLLERRQTLDEQSRARTPVPVLFDLTGWDTTLDLRDWLAHALAGRFAGLTTQSARAVLDAALVLPILDGLDEMDPPGQPPARARAALRQLNMYLAGSQLLPVVLTCRQQEYEHLSDELAGAVEAVIDPLHPDQICDYMTDELAGRADQHARAAWHLLESNEQVLALLTTPWALTLLAVYLRGGGTADSLTPQPQEHPDAFDQRAREALLDQYIPVRARASGDRYNPGQARCWSTALAVNLGDDIDILLTDIWRVGGPARVRAIQAVATAVLLTIAITTTLVFSTLPQDPAAKWTLAALGVPMVIAGGVRAVALAASDSVEPVVGNLALGQLRTPQGRKNLARNLRGGLPLSLAGALAFGLTFGFTFGPTVGLTFGLMIGLMIVLTIVLKSSLTVKEGALVVVGPANSVHSDLAALFAFVFVFGSALRVATVGLTDGPTAWPVWGTLTLGLTLALMFGLGATWMRYACGLGVAAWRGLSPLRPARYLRWAHGAGILRRSGPTYQFRHLSLRDHLQAQHQGSCETGPTWPAPN